MRDRGLALIGVGEASGEGRAALALEQALTNPLLESTDISQATGVLASSDDQPHRRARSTCLSSFWPSRRAP